MKKKKSSSGSFENAFRTPPSRRLESFSSKKESFRSEEDQCSTQQSSTRSVSIPASASSSKKPKSKSSNLEEAQDEVKLSKSLPNALPSSNNTPSATKSTRNAKIFPPEGLRGGSKVRASSIDMQETMNATPRTSPPPPIHGDFSKRLIGETWWGRIDYGNGSYYCGDLFKKETGEVVRQGKGTSHDAGKNKVYEGDFLDDLKHGHGTTRYLEKMHRGQYERGLRNGLGVFIFENGDRYEGEFSRGEIHGKGLMNWVDGSSFEGTWKRGKMKSGVKKWRDRLEEYEGAFNEHGQPHGFGVFRYSNGDVHRGFFVAGFPHGKGERFTQSQGTLKYAEFERGKPKSSFVITLGSRLCFIGQHEAKDDDNQTIETSLTFGRFDGDDLPQEHDEEDEQDGQIRVRLGHFLYDPKVFPPSLKRGTYSTATSRVSAQIFGAGPVVNEGATAAWHDVETGNVRWSRLGPSGMGPVGKALFVFANSNSRLEVYGEEGVLSDLVAI